jgi:hypothetical protein
LFVLFVLFVFCFGVNFIAFQVLDSQPVSSFNSLVHI